MNEPAPEPAAADVTQPVPVVDLVAPSRPVGPLRWAWRNRRGLLSAVFAGGLAVVLVLGVSFGWADASDRASELEHTVNAREKDLARAERKLRNAKKEERKVSKSLAEATAANQFLEAAYQGSQSELQRANGLVTSLQSQLATTSLQVTAAQTCVDGVVTSVITRTPGTRRADAVNRALASSC